MSDQEKPQRAAIGCGIALLLSPLLALWWGYVAKLVWLWFYTPLGAPQPPSAWHLAGLALGLTMLRRQSPHDTRPAYRQVEGAIWHSLAMPGIVLLSALIYRAFAF